MDPAHTFDEYLDLVDENDTVVGKKKRSGVYAEHLSNFRVVNAFVVNSKGEMRVPRRAANKRIFPLCLDMSMGGHVESGETYEDALKRETQEELKFDTDKANVRLLGHLSPQKGGVSAHMSVYEMKLRAASSAVSDEGKPFDSATLRSGYCFVSRIHPRGLPRGILRTKQ